MQILWIYFALIEKYPQLTFNAPDHFVSWMDAFPIRFGKGDGENLFKYNRFIKEPRLDIMARMVGLDCVVSPTIKEQWANKPLAHPDLRNKFVLAPYSRWKAREWGEVNFIYLAKLLGVENCVMLHDRMVDWNITRKGLGLPPDEVMQIIYHSKMVIGVDSGLMHCAAALQKPFLALCSIYKGWNVFGRYKSANWLNSQMGCTGCMYEQPLSQECQSHCAAIKQITPQEVAYSVKSIVNGDYFYNQK